MKSLDPNSPAARDLASGRYRIRNLDAAGIAAITIPWMRDAGWNPGMNDAETYFTADPEGFFVGELNGDPIATISCVRYDEAFGFIGCYIVKESFRAHGYGMAICEATIGHLRGCTAGGDGVLENVEKYKQIGAEYAWRNARYEGIKCGPQSALNREVLDAREIPLAQLEELDAACFPAKRTAFLNAWLHQPGTHALAMRDPKNDSTVRGYGVIRPCFRGWKIGPLFARDSEAGGILFDELIHRIPDGDPFVLDVPEPNAAAMDLVRRRSMNEVFATARMYIGPFPKLNLGWTFGITTFELG